MFTIFSVPLSDSNPKTFGDELLTHLKQNNRFSISTINPEILLAAKKNRQFGALLSEHTYRVIDGVGISLLIWLKFGHISHRITGSRVITALCEAADQLGYTVGLFGGGGGVATKAAQELSNKYPHAKFLDMADGSFVPVSLHGNISPIDLEKISNKITTHNIRILLIGLGAPKQEIIMKQIMETRPTVLASAGIGGLLDVISGTIKSPPRLLTRIGLEWLWRVVQQPSRILRIIKAVIIFPIASFASLKKI